MKKAVAFLLFAILLLPMIARADGILTDGWKTATLESLIEAKGSISSQITALITHQYASSEGITLSGEGLSVTDGYTLPAGIWKRTISFPSSGLYSDKVTFTKGGSNDSFIVVDATTVTPLQVKEKIDLALWSSEEWQEVIVPQGVWRIGIDIPEGHWTIKMADTGRGSWCGLTYSDRLDESGLKAERSGRIYVYQQLARPDSNYNAPLQIDIELKSGTYLVIDNADVVFQTYIGKPKLGFK